jgi:glycerate kinase
MKIIIAPDKFKRSLTGLEFCQTVEEVLKKCIAGVEVIKIPLADGGDGTLEALSSQMTDTKVHLTVHDPLFRPIQASYLYLEEARTAFIEMAEASGLRKLKEEEQNCFYTTSYGTGELIKDALDHGAQKIILGIGGSATNDCGMGMAEALGYQFLDQAGNKLEPIGKNLIAVDQIVTTAADSRIGRTLFEVACDVTNPLFGRKGAAKVYAPQKGATDEEVALLDQGLEHFEQILGKTFDRSVKDIPGAGAAGGLGAGAMLFLGGTLNSGIKLVKEMVKFDERIAGADWIITGEGKLDYQTLSGKTVHGVLESAVLQGIKVAVFCGRITLPQDAMNAIGVSYAASVMERSIDLDDAIKHSIIYLREMVAEFAGRISVKD